MTKKSKQTMKSTKHNLPLSEQVMEKIDNQELKMLPKLYFWAGSTLLGIGSVVIFGLTIMLVSLWMFHMRMQQLFSPEAFDLIHRPMFLTRFPWSSFAIAILSFGLGLVLIKKYDFAYKKNWGVIVLGMLLGVVLMAGLIDGSGLNERLSRDKRVGRFYGHRVDDRVKGRMYLKEISR